MVCWKKFIWHVLGKKIFSALCCSCWDLVNGNLPSPKALENKKELEEGHVILAVNGEPTDGAQDARRALRNAFDDKRDEVKLTVWKAPDDFVFPDTAGEGTAAVGENGGQFDVVVQEAMLMTESERVNVKMKKELSAALKAAPRQRT